MITTAHVELPSFGRETRRPQISVGEYRGRLAGAVERMARLNLDILAVYADREHAANMAFLTGFDPRFEEALLLLDRQGRRALLVGNECMGYLPDAALSIEPVLFQEFSLMGQPRDGSRPLRQILSDFGIGPGQRVGCAGWKYYGAGRLDDPEHALEIPSYLADALRGLVGERSAIVNANAIFMDPTNGLRILNSAAQIAVFEFAAIQTSESVLAVMRHMRAGAAECDLELFLFPNGLPLSCHNMLGFGEKARRGLASPSENRAKLGDAYTVAFGVWGSLTARAGAVARSVADLPEPLRDFYPRYVTNYYDVVTTWYATLRLGIEAGRVFAAVEARRDPALFDFAVNPGHYIHLDEWVHSPFARGSTVPLQSGMALQMDIIPISRGPFCCANVEDGVALADVSLRAGLARDYPDCWRRIQKRRQFMSEALGIPVDESVLPLGNMPGWLPPYVLDLDTALVRR